MLWRQFRSLKPAEMHTSRLGRTVGERAVADCGEAAGFSGGYVDGADGGHGGDVDDAGGVVGGGGSQEEGFETDRCVVDCLDV